MNLKGTWKYWAPALGAGSLAAVLWWRQRRRRESLRPETPRLASDPRDCTVWRFDNRFSVLPSGKVLRFEVPVPAIVRWTTDNWDTVHDTRTLPLQSMWVADVPTASLDSGARVQFTFYWPEVGRWEGQDFEVLTQAGARYGGVSGG